MAGIAAPDFSAAEKISPIHSFGNTRPGGIVNGDKIDFGFNFSNPSEWNRRSAPPSTIIDP